MCASVALTHRFCIVGRRDETPAGLALLSHGTQALRDTSGEGGEGEEGGASITTGSIRRAGGFELIHAPSARGNQITTARVPQEGDWPGPRQGIILIIMMMITVIITVIIIIKCR